MRFVPKSDLSKVLIGEPAEDILDVGAAVRKGNEVRVQVLSGASALNPGQKTGQTEKIEKLLSPLHTEEVGTIRCIGLNASGKTSRRTHVLFTLSTNRVAVQAARQRGQYGCADRADSLLVSWFQT